MPLTREQIADLIARKSIESGSYENLLEHQKTIDADPESDTYGRVVVGRQPGDRMLLFRSDYFANPEDQPYIDDGQITASMEDGGVWPEGWDPFGSEGGGQSNLWLPPNVGQFIGFDSGSVSVDPVLFKELVDTTITELVPSVQTRQDKINKFFDDYFELRGDIPPYINAEIGEINLESDEYLDYLWNNNISFIQDVPGGGDDSAAAITRLNLEANDNNTIDEASNTFRTLEFLYMDLQDRLKDVQFANESVLEDDRDEYEEDSEGYMEIANLNDALLINNSADTNQSGDTGMSDDSDTCMEIMDQTACEDPNDNLDCVWSQGMCITGDA